MIIGDLQKDGDIIEEARHDADQLLQNDPTLAHSENTMLREQYKRLFAHTFDWSRIG